VRLPAPETPHQRSIDFRAPSFLLRRQIGSGFLTLGSVGVCVGTAQACASADSATALSHLEYPEAAQAADTALAKSRELWQPTRADPGGDLDRPASYLEIERGRLDAAEPFAASLVHHWESGGHVSRTLSGVTLAIVHVRAASLTAYGWPTVPLPARQSSARYRWSAGDSNRWPPRWRPAPVPTPHSWPGWPGRCAGALTW